MKEKVGLCVFYCVLVPIYCGLDTVANTATAAISVSSLVPWGLDVYCPVCILIAFVSTPLDIQNTEDGVFSLV